MTAMEELEFEYYTSSSANLRLSNTGHSIKIDSGNCKNVIFPKISKGIQYVTAFMDA